MIPPRSKKTIVLGLIVFMSAAATSEAKTYQNVIRGMELFGYQFSGEPNLLGDGWTVFATANYTSNTEFDLGFATLTVDGALVSASAGYTLRGLPKAEFSLGTFGFTGAPTPLDYTLKLKNGIQDVSIAGSVLINIDSEINQLGFYEQTLQISNRAIIETEGCFAEDSDSLDFDIGPINVSGNVYVDAIAAATQPFFNATGTENPFSQYSQTASAIAGLVETADELEARLTAGEVLTHEELGILANNSIIASVLGTDASGTLFNDLFAPEDILGTRLLSAAPEPTSLALLGMTSLGLLWRRRT